MFAATNGGINVELAGRWRYCCAAKGLVTRAEEQGRRGGNIFVLALFLIFFTQVRLGGDAPFLLRWTYGNV